MSWFRDAACQGENVEMFFSIVSTVSAVFQLADAGQICTRLSGAGPVFGVGPS